MVHCPIAGYNERVDPRDECREITSNNTHAIDISLHQFPSGGLRILKNEKKRHEDESGITMGFTYTGSIEAPRKKRLGVASSVSKRGSFMKNI